MSLPSRPVADATPPHAQLIQMCTAYWVSRLRDHAAEDTPIDLPTDRPRAAEQSFRGGTLVFEVPSETTSRLRDLASSLGVSAFAVALSAFGLVSLMRSARAWDDPQIRARIVGIVSAG